jgi:hypothetical protein
LEQRAAAVAAQMIRNLKSEAQTPEGKPLRDA